MSDVAWMLGGGVSHDANVPRWATAALAGDVGGVCGAGHLAVSQDDTPGMRVKVAAGYVLVKGGSTLDQGVYAWYYTGGTVDIAPGDPSNPRNDIVGVQVEDDFWDASGENRCRLVVVAGTPAGSPADPALPASFTPLARVRVDQNESTSIVNGDLTDLRTLVGPWGLPWGVVASVQSATTQTGVTTLVDVTNMAVTPTLVAGRRYKVTAEVAAQQLTNAGTLTLTLADGSNTELRSRRTTVSTASGMATLTMLYEHVAVSTGPQTFKLRAASSAESMTLRPTGAVTPHQLLVEDIGPA